MTIGTTLAHGVSKAAVSMDDRQARGESIAQNIKNVTSQGQAVDLLQGMRDALQTRMNNGSTNRNTLIRLVHTTQTTQDMAFQTLNKKWGNSTRTLETKAALLAEFETAGWDTTELNTYLDTITTRQDRILEGRIFTILENATNKAQAEGPNIRVDNGQTTNPWSTDATDHAPQIGAGAQGVVYQIKINDNPMVVKIFDQLKLPPPVQLDPQQTTPHIKRDLEVTAAFLKSQTSSVIQPKYFLVTVTADGASQELLVKGGKDFKEWSKAQLWDSEAGSPRANPPQIQITGLAMPLAEGKTLDAAVTEKPVNFSQTANSALNSLVQLARNGFVHGDIKPANLFVKNDGNLSLIDTGSMAKISKNADARLLPLPSDSFDKATRPSTPHFTHPGHPPGFKKVGMEQDLFSMGVTLLETKLLNIAKALGPDDAEEFTDVANQILNTINDENQAPDQSSAATIRDKIRTQLDDLKLRYPGAFSDGELDWAEKTVNKALDQTQPVTNRETWNDVLSGIRNSIPADPAGRHQALERLRSLGCNNPRAAMEKFNNLRTVMGAVTEEETNLINQKFFGGGNSIFTVLYENPGLLDPNQSTEDRQTAFFQAFEPFQAIARENNLREIESQVAELIESGQMHAAEQVRTALQIGAVASEEVNRNDIVNSLSDPALIASFQKFQTAASQNNLSAQDAMVAIRSRANILTLNSQNIAQHLNDLFASRPIPSIALSDINTLFPPAST